MAQDGPVCSPDTARYRTACGLEKTDSRGHAAAAG